MGGVRESTGLDYLLKGALVLFQEVLPRGRIQPHFSQQIQAFLQTFAREIAWVVDEQVILQHFLRQRPGEEALISLCIDRHKAPLLSSHLFELGDDACRGVIISRSKDLLAEDLGTALDRCDYVFAFDGTTSQ